MLVFEHPPGTGFSYCHDESGSPVDCVWDDSTQADAFVASIEAWGKGYEEFATRGFNVIGESYAGLLMPNLFHAVAKSASPIKLNALAVGNGCTGIPGMSPESPGTCNLGGNFDLPHNIELFYGHGMMSKRLHTEIVTACNFSCEPKLSACPSQGGPACSTLIQQMTDLVGDYNVYNIYGRSLVCGVVKIFKVSYIYIYALTQVAVSQTRVVQVTCCGGQQTI
jgi:hypothetical protein